ncbi:LVIVD repeat-containing protein [Dokdonella soli]|uniref:PKD domain-containing protein n=1 Tax=Dokdonella soli TaxID=529810 RepID=A0ABN1IZ42_9GAMM
MKLLRAGGFILLSLLIFVGAAQSATLTLADVGGGSLSPPVAQGNYLYVGTGTTLTTWNMTDPAHPVVADRTNRAPAPGPVRALAMVGGYLYAAWNSPSDTGGITIYSLADPAHPLAVAEIDNYVAGAMKRPVGLAAAGNYVYLGDADNGLVVLDASNPLAPVYAGMVSGVYEFDAMGVYGGKLLTTGSSFIGGRVVHVVDVSNPAAPVEVGNTALDGSIVLRAVLTDGYAIGVGNDLMVYDLHDPAHITKVFDAPIAVATHAIRAGNVLYLVGASGIQVWNFTTPSAPTLLRTVAMDAFAPDQAAATSFGPVILTHTDRGLVLGVSDPLNPVLAASFTLPFGVSVHAGDFDASHAYFAEEGYGLGAFNATTLASLGRYDAALPASLAARDMEDMSVDGGRAYLAAWGYGVLIASLADPANPTELGRFAFPFASAIEAHGNRVYVASTTNGGIFKILDVSNPASPQELGSLTTSQTFDLTVRGNYAFLVDGSAFGTGGLRVVDVSNPAAPLLVGQYSDCASAGGVDVSADGNTAYVACDDGSLRIVNTSNKANPVLLGSVTLPGSASLPNYNVAHAVVVVGTVAYVGNEEGVDEVDVSHPQAPVQTARHETGFFVSRLALAPDGRVFAFAQEAGTYVFAPITDRIFANGFD